MRKYSKLYAEKKVPVAGTPSGISVPANPLQWSSEVYDSELDLVYYNYRHYSPDLGRFLSRDPIQEQWFRQGPLLVESGSRNDHSSEGNPYFFVKNIPIIYSDELGLDITLESTDSILGLHQQVCVETWNFSKAGCTEDNKRACCYTGKVCFSFGMNSNISPPVFSSTWLGWNDVVAGATLLGEVYLPVVEEYPKIENIYVTTMKQDTNWANYMFDHRRGLVDAYSLARHNCRIYSQWEFRDAPLHW